MKSIVKLILFLAICFSCSKEEPNEYEPYLKGSIVGFAMLTDQYGSLLEDHSGITVYTEPGRKYSGKTNSKGRFEIKGVPTGTYNLSFEKEGFGTMKYPEVHHLGGQATVLGMPTYEYMYNGRVVLHEEITHPITNMTLDGNFIRVDIEYFGEPLMRYLEVRLFFSTSNGFQIADAQYVYNVSTYEDPVFYFELTDLPLISGTTVYCKGSLFTSSAIYYDPVFFPEGDIISIDNYTDTNGKTVYPNLTEESDQYAFIIP